MLSMMSEEDEDGQKVVDKIPDYVLEHNFVIRLAVWRQRVHMSIPLPYGLNFAVNMGVASQEEGEVGTQMASFNSFFGTFVDAVNPIGGTESLANFVAPTVADPFIDIVRKRGLLKQAHLQRGFTFRITETRQPALLVNHITDI